MAACETMPVVVDDAPPTVTTTGYELLVLPLSGLSSTVGAALGEKMAWGMREAGYQAKSTSVIDDSSPMLTGWIEEASDGGDVIWLNINWSVYKAGGTELGGYRQETAVSRDGWTRLSPDTLAVIVAQAVPIIHEMVEAEIYPDGIPETVIANIVQPEIDLTPPKPETIVVSGDGISRIDSSGIEIMDAPLSVADEPTFAPSNDPELAARVDYPEGFASGGPVLPVSEALLLPSEGQTNASAQEPAQIMPETTAESSLEFQPEPSLEFQPEASLEFQPESSLEFQPEPSLEFQPEPSLEFQPESTPQQDTRQNPEMDESLIELGLTPEDVGEALGSVQQGVLQPTVAPPLPAATQQATVPVAVINPQPALADGNAALGFVRPVFLVRNVVGAPGDGNLALRTAVLRALREADAMVTDNPAQASYIIQGSVQMAVPFAGRQHTRVIWLVTTIAGEEVGTAIQENNVPQGSLDGNWGGVAHAIATSAISGIAQLFDTRLDAGTAQGNLAQPDLPHFLGDPLP